ncbi:serine/threonine protein kinase [Hyalangium versicolor]|uniref:serine/threonine protein kinase n=1 Tax=Hyalangium versicolor TaxID=2861190 RepID=UPI001CC9F5DF|nr:serine/threonine-protein kinase [Hyalangium versicolor]
MQIGKYRLIHKLATGGMAEVFLAKAAGPMGFEKLLVLKRILPHLATEATFVEMFLTEARLAAHLNHPNVAQIFDFGEAEGTYFLAMEYVDGPNLREIVRRASAVGLALPLAFCARVVASACEGLSFAHTFSDPVSRQPMNIIHRDISPDNILLSRQGAVKVVDFGIAKAAGVSPHTQTGVLKGKLAYMSPEQLRNEALDPRADVYALGVVLYELLTGLKPFIASSEAGMVQAVLFEMQVPVLQRRPDVPDAIQRVLAKALAKERDRRYPDCVSFQADLEEFIVSTGKPMGAAQIAQIVSMMTAGVENPVPPLQTNSSAPSNPRLALASSAQRPLEPTAPSPEKSVGGNAMVRGLSQPSGEEASGLELTAAARPSQLILRNGGQVLHVGGGAVEPTPPAPPPPTLPAPAEKDLAWVARVGILLFLAGGAVLMQRHSFKAGGEATVPPSTRLETDPRKGVTSPPDGTEVTPPGPPVPPVTVSQNPPPADDSHTTGENSSRDAGVELPAVIKPPQVRQPPPKDVLDEPLQAGQGTLELRVHPGAMLFLDGWQLGRVPEKPFAVDAGPHIVRLVNAALRKEVTRRITVVEGQATRIEVNLLLEK